MEEDGLAVVDAVEHAAVAVGPEGKDVVFLGQPLGQGLGPVARPRHEVGAGVLGDLRRGQLAGVKAGEAEAQRAAPARVHAAETQSHLRRDTSDELLDLFFILSKR